MSEEKNTNENPTEPKSVIADKKDEKATAPPASASPESPTQPPAPTSATPPTAASSPSSPPPPDSSSPSTPSGTPSNDAPSAGSSSPVPAPAVQIGPDGNPLPAPAPAPVQLGPDGQPLPTEPQPEFNPEISADLEKKIQEELERKKEESGEKTVTREQFIASLKDKRAKIIYHALYYLAFVSDDHMSTKAGLYEALKEVTSKDPMEPIAEQKFYFGLTPILKLKLFDSPVITFVKDKLKLMPNIENFQKILNEIGDPISERPQMAEEVKQDLFSSFLKESSFDFLETKKKTPAKPKPAKPKDPNTAVEPNDAKPKKKKSAPSDETVEVVTSKKASKDDKKKKA